MSSSRFLYSNFADSELGAALYAGGAPPGGYAVLSAAAGYAAANVLNPDPYTVVKFAGANGLIDIDLGQARPVEGVGLFNVYLDSGTNFPAIHVYSSVDNATWDDHGLLFESAGWSAGKHRAYRLPAIYSRRYWRIYVTTGTAWYIGNVYIGAWLDFADYAGAGAMYSAGDFDAGPPIADVETPSGTRITHILGASRRTFTNTYNLVPGAFARALVALSAAWKPFGYLDVDDAVYYARLNAKVAPSRILTAEDYWSLQVAMESMP